MITVIKSNDSLRELFDELDTPSVLAAQVIFYGAQNGDVFNRVTNAGLELVSESEYFEWVDITEIFIGVEAIVDICAEQGIHDGVYLLGLDEREILVCDIDTFERNNREVKDYLKFSVDRESIPHLF